MLNNNEIIEISEIQKLFASEVLPKLHSESDFLEQKVYKIDHFIDFAIIGNDSKETLKTIISNLDNICNQVNHINKEITSVLSNINVMEDGLWF